MGEYGNGGPNSAGQAEYIWLPTDAGQTIPIGLYKNKRLYAIHSDHLDTPRQITDDSNQPVWQWPYSAFGDNLPTGVLKAKKVESEGNDDREREGSRVTTTSVITTATVQLKATDPAITLNLRFAGQYRDSETGLFYNGMRSYAPQLGAYTQMDPIGLGGGLNRRGYVEGNPFSATDPTGEFFHTTAAAWPNFIPGFFRPNPWLPIPAPPPYNPVTDTFTPQPAIPSFVLPPMTNVVPIVTIINSILDACTPKSAEAACKDQWIADVNWCDSKWNRYTRKGQACHAWAGGNYDRCLQGDSREPWRL